VGKKYHIYVKQKFLYCCLSEEEFNEVWGSLQKLTWVTDYNEEDLTYEEV
jgi:hypothetical protein